MEIPSDATLTRLAESVASSGHAKIKVKNVTNIFTKKHPRWRNVTILSFSALLADQMGEKISTEVLMKTPGQFSHEMQVYSTLFRDLQPNIENKKAIQNILHPLMEFRKGNLYTLIPRPLLIEKPNLFLENLESKQFGFKGLDYANAQNKLGGNPFNLDFGHCLLAVETLAKLHATSYIFRQLHGLKGKGKMELLQKYPFLNQSSITSVFSPFQGAKLSPVFEKAFDLALVAIESENPSLAFKLRRKLQNSAGIFEKCIKLLEDEKYENDDFYVLCTGNFLPENLLFSYDTSGPKECRMTNLDSVFIGPLAADLALFFLFSTTYEFRLEFEEKILAFYCDSFQEQVQSLVAGKGSAAEQVYQEFEENIDEFHRKLEKQYRKMLEFAFYNVCVLLPLAFYKRSNENNNNEETKTTSLLDLLEIGNHNFVGNDTFEKFTKNNAFLRERLIDILKQLAKCRVLL